MERQTNQMSNLCAKFSDGGTEHSGGVRVFFPFFPLQPPPALLLHRAGERGKIFFLAQLWLTFLGCVRDMPVFFHL